MVSISVVMPVFNTTAAILKEAVESILSQTFQDFEFIIIDDGSTDDSSSYLQSLQDERIKLIRNPENLGIVKSLNIGLCEAKGKYVARMDSDDIAFPMRFQKQFDYMENHPEVIVCGTNMEFFGAGSGITHNQIIDMDIYRIQMLFFNPGPPHPTVFLNCESLKQFQLKYDEELNYAEDYGLWTEASKHGQVYIMEDVLLRYRLHSAQTSNVYRNEQIQCVKYIQKKLLEKIFDNLTEEDLNLHYKYSPFFNRTAKVNNEMRKWYDRLVDANNRTGVYNKKKFEAFVYDGIMKHAVCQAFDQDMSDSVKIEMLFRYLPLKYAAKAAIKMGERKIKS